MNPSRCMRYFERTLNAATLFSFVRFDGFSEGFDLTSEISYSNPPLSIRTCLDPWLRWKRTMTES